MPNYIKGDLFSHVGKGTVILAHACNPFGSWGGGVAAQFRKRYPYSNKLYADHCKQTRSLLGTCLLVPTTEVSELESAEVLIACLFTSDFECDEANILDYTRSSIDSLTKQLQALEHVEKDLKGLPVVNMPQINSGIFNVPWENTEAVLNEKTQVSFNVYII